MKLEKRIQKLEGRTFSGPPAMLCGIYTPRDPNDPALTAGPDETGKARISLYWAVWFLKGTREEQKKELQQLRRDPRFHHPPKEEPNGIGGEKVFMQYINGGCWDMAVLKIHEAETK
ncbi:MAG TPA: hypothetical protein VNO43_00865 [Candidatus Eisenbacteria bacterium]|nr:hypothetical protein [Candidatus Eisenbacteria bacterium]